MGQTKSGFGIAEIRFSSGIGVGDEGFVGRMSKSDKSEERGVPVNFV